MFAPMSLMTFDEARPWARSIKQRVVAGAMPPWGADTPHGMFKNDPRLSQQEIDTIAAWVDAGAPKGDDKDLPPVPKFADGWSIGKPDAIFTMDEEFTIPATGTIPYKYFKAPTGLTEDKWIQAIEIHPSARAQVHHVLAYTQPAGTAPKPGGELGPDQHRRRDAEQAGPGVRAGSRPPAQRQLRHRHADPLHGERHGGARTARRSASSTPSSRRRSWRPAAWRSTRAS